MSKIIFFGVVLFLIGTDLNAQQFSKLANAQDNNDFLEKAWSVHEDNVLKRRKATLKDTIVFDFNYKDHLSNFVESKPVSSKVKAIEMPNFKPDGNYPMAIYPIDTTTTYAARIYKD